MERHIAQSPHCIAVEMHHVFHVFPRFTVCDTRYVCLRYLNVNSILVANTVVLKHRRTHLIYELTIDTSHWLRHIIISTFLIVLFVYIFVCLLSRLLAGFFSLSHEYVLTEIWLTISILLLMFPFNFSTEIETNVCVCVCLKRSKWLRLTWIGPFFLPSLVFRELRDQIVSAKVFN